jgi:preprotein translocase subunit SecF
MAKPGVKQPEVSGSKAHKASFGRWDFVKLAPLMGGFSLLATIISLLVIFGKGFNYGIDFAGGTEVQVKFSQKVDASDLRKYTESIGLKNTSVQSIGDQNEFLIRMESAKAASDKESAEIERSDVKKLTNGLKQKYNLSEDGIRRIDSVGPQVGSELKRNGFLAAFYSFLVILIYVAIRFDYKYAPGAVVCLIHDSIFTLGIFAILGREVNVQIMAAVLTLIGYSLNDTIVTYDRIRETYPAYREYGLKFIINKAVNDMLGRTILTAGCTFMAVLALYLLGGGVISDIGFTLVIGILIGTYSSVYVAAPLILVMDSLSKKKVLPA